MVGGRSVCGGEASGHRSPMEVGRGGEGETENEGWSEESGGRDATSDAEMEEDEGRHAPLTASLWNMQESEGRGLRVDARDGGSDGGKGTSATADRGEMQGRHEVWKEHRKRKRGLGGWERTEPWGVGGTVGAARPP